MNRRKIIVNVVAPVVALLFAAVVSGIVLQIAGYSARTALETMWANGWRRESVVSAISRSIPYYIAGVAVAIGFIMNLFNIGVEGQYRVGALIAAWVGAYVILPAPLHVLLICVVAMAVSAAYAVPVAVLKVKRGVHEVITSIMLNGIALSLIAYLLRNYMRYEVPGSFAISTKELPRSGQMPTLDRFLHKIGFHFKSGPGVHLHGTIVIAILVGIAYWILLNRTRFGFDLRASGLNPWAARTSGVQPDRMVIATLLMSGAVAGLIGMTALLGDAHQYNLGEFPTGLGFTGIAVALLGRNNPVGIAFAAFLFGWLDRAALSLSLVSIPPEIVKIMQGVIVLAVVIAYEIVGRVDRAQEAAAAARVAGATSSVEAAA